MNDEPALYPLHVFRFHVDFREARPKSGGSGLISLCGGAFSECTGLEATMEPKVIKEGGHNYGVQQRAGPVTFATVVLKRGLTNVRDLWKWFELVGGGAYAYRLSAVINVYGPAVPGSKHPKAVLAWELDRALPVKFKAADLNARSTEVGVEELHLAHEGLRPVAPTRRRL
jgi:phage tail-like protein